MLLSLDIKYPLENNNNNNNNNNISTSNSRKLINVHALVERHMPERLPVLR